jgi:hypothetical protein
LSNSVIGFDTSATQHPVRHTWDRTRGAQTIRSYSGTQDQIRALELQFQFAGWSTDVKQGPVWSLDATWGLDDRSGSSGGGEEPVDTWELFANATEKDLFQTNLPGIVNMPNIDKHFCRSVMDGKIDVTHWDYSDTAHTPVWLGDSTQQGLADQIFRGLCSGMKSRRVNVPTLRHTKTASRGYEFTAALSGVDEIFSSTALALAETLPVPIYRNMIDPPASNPATRTDGIIVCYGWHKHYPQIQISAMAKSQIIVEWEYGEWATVMYPTYHV